jgi:nuclear pore complex protein Nup54
VSALGSTLRPAASTTQMTDAQNQYIRMTEKIEMVYNAWNPDSPRCRFQHAFYNLVDPRQVSLYGRPANAKDDAAWEKAVRENPDPSWYVRVPTLHSLFRFLIL